MNRNAVFPDLMVSMAIKTIKLLLIAPILGIISLIFIVIWAFLGYIDAILFDWVYLFILLLAWCFIFLNKVQRVEWGNFMNGDLFRFLLCVDFVIISICLLLLSYFAKYCDVRSPWCFDTDTTVNYWEKYVSDNFYGYFWFIIPLFLITIIWLANADNILKMGYKNFNNTDKNF